MTRQPRRSPLVAIVLMLLGSGADAPRAPAKKAVLVELFVSQGCDMCPSAEGLVAALASDERVVPISFHVDYFNDPWRDPYSDPRFSRREMQYSRLYDRKNKLKNPNYLYLTPLVMIDGRVPMVGKDDAATKARLSDAIRRALDEPPVVAIDAAFGEGGALEVTLEPIGPSLRGRAALLAAVPFTAETATNVPSGELAGHVYRGRSVARGLELRPVKLPKSGKLAERFALTPPERADPKADGVVVFVQDEATGHILQAASVNWPVESRRSSAEAGRRR